MSITENLINNNSKSEARYIVTEESVKITLEAYPNYFADTKEFNNVLKAIVMKY